MKNRTIAWVIFCTGFVCACSDDSEFVVYQPSYWVNCETEADCPDGMKCLNNLCAKLPDTCESGTMSCANRLLYKCENGNWRSETICEYACNDTADGCQPPPEVAEPETGSACAEGSLQCNGNAIEICSGGKWTLQNTCTTGCSETTLSCNPSTDGKCTDGEYQCNGNALEICSGGEWTIQTTCAAGCSNSACNPEPECESGAKRCLDNVISACEAGHWVTQSTCENGCREDAGEYVCNSCAAGSVKCAENKVTQCDGGVWKDVQTCENGCAEDGISCAVPPECKDGKVVCADGVKRTCVDGHFNSGTPCEYGCRAGGSDCAICAASALRCSDTKLEVCGGGSWVSATTCPYGCNATADGCNACKSGTTRCKNDKKSTCTNGSWGTESACANGCNDAGTDCASANQMVATRYLETDIHSPITPYVAKQMRDIAAKSSNKRANVFMKIGDSHYNYSFDGRFMKCFSNATSQKVSLDGRTELQAAIDAFQSVTDSFNRDSEAAVGGMSTRYSFNGTPTHLTSEINAMKPRFAFFGHGSNDMGNGSYCHTGTTCPSGVQGYAWALQDYYRQIDKTMNQLISEGIVPLISGVAPRNDKPSNINYIGGGAIASTSDYPTHMVAAFNAVSRGSAEALQVPFFNVHRAIYSLSNNGLSSDNMHTSYSGSPCDFTANGLKYGAHQRNLGSIQMLSKAWNVVVNNADAPDKVGKTFEGSGTASSPYLVSSIPFTHSQNTSTGGSNVISSYNGCSTASECGNEFYYKMTLDSTKRLRLFALSASGVDVDIQIMRANATAAACVARDDIMVQGTFAKGTYYISVDSYCNSGKATPGKYLLGIVECDTDDNNCNKSY